MIAGGNEIAHMIEMWIALNVRQPEKLLGAALFVKDIQSDGKTILFRHLMAAVMGVENVTNIANSEIRSDL